MRFIYRWSNPDDMSESVYLALDKAENQSNLPLPAKDVDYKRVWWVPLGFVEQFRNSMEYLEAQREDGQLYEIRAMVEHSGHTFVGVFFVSYDMRGLAAA